MRFYAKGALCFLFLCCAAICPGLGQSREQGAERSVSGSTERASSEAPLQHAALPRLLSPNGGLAILSAALDSRHRGADDAADCSHFVHGIYERAGLPYPYASSADLYRGTDEFRRVTIPQVGDLAVWRGHAGIVVSPPQHSFFSVLRSGPGIDSYDSPYWKRRGQPRFLRYVEPVPGGTVRTLIHAASWRPDSTTPRDPAGEDSDPDVSESASDVSPDSGSSAQLTQSRSGNIAMARSLIVNSVRPKPELVRSTFLEACQDSPSSVREAELLRSTQSVVVFDDFEVKKIHITGNQGWVEVQIAELASLTGIDAEVTKRSVRQRWPLNRRDSTTWRVTLPQDTVYLPQRFAVKILAHALAQLTEDNSETTSTLQEKTGFARLLNGLLEN